MSVARSAHGHQKALVVSGDTYLPGVEDDLSEEAINIIPNQVTNLDANYGEAINQVFSERYLSLLKNYQSSFDYLGIHYRGGMLFMVSIGMINTQ